MKKFLASLLIFVGISTVACAQPGTISLYKRTSVMVPMRNGIKLYTVILSPVNAIRAVPFLIERTPYGADDIPVAVDTFSIPGGFYFANMASEGYIFVTQDIRG